MIENENASNEQSLFPKNEYFGGELKPYSDTTIRDRTNVHEPVATTSVRDVRCDGRRTELTQTSLFVQSARDRGK